MWEEMDAMSVDIPNLIKDKDNDFLDLPISEEEVLKAFWSLLLDKAPEHDGLSIMFFRRSWHIIKRDLIRMLN